MTEYKKCVAGTYTVWLNRIKFDVTKSGKNRCSIAYKVAEGEYKGSFIWDNTTLDSEKGFSILQTKFSKLAPNMLFPDFVNCTDVFLQEIADKITESCKGLYKVDLSYTDEGFTRVYATPKEG